MGQAEVRNWALVVGVLWALSPLAATPAAAQVTYPWPDPLPTTLQPCPGPFVGAADFCTYSSTDHTTHIRVDLPDLQTYSTEVRGAGILTGLGGTTTSIAFDQTANAAPGTPVVDALFVQAAAAARSAAVALAGGRPFVITDTGPVLTSSSSFTGPVTLISSIPACPLGVGISCSTGVAGGTQHNVVLLGSGPANGLFVLADLPEHVLYTLSASITVGPGTVLVGADQTASVFVPCHADGSGPPPRCDATNINFNLAFEHFYEDDYQATTLNSAIYGFFSTATIGLIGTVYPDTHVALEDDSTNFLRKLRDAGQGVIIAPGARTNLLGGGGAKLDGGWMEAYGAWSAIPTQGMIPGDNRLNGGIRAGLTAKLSDTAAAGFGFDQGFGVVTVPDASESASVTHTQAGLHAALDLDPVSLDFAAVAGLGHVDATHGSAALGGISSGSFDFRTAGLIGELGYKLEADGWTVTPLVGGDLTAVHTDAFTEIGPTALTVSAADALRLRAWLGLTASRSVTLASGQTLDFGFTTRLIDTLSGSGHALPVILAGTPMTLDGLNDGQYALEANLNLALHLTWQSALTLDAAGSISSTGSTSVAVHAGLRGTF